MQSFLDSISAVVLILLMTAAGYFCGAMGWMTRENKRFLVRYIIDIAMPCMCVTNLMGSVTREMLKEAGTLLLVPLCTIILCFFITLLCARLLKLERKKLGVFVAMSCVSNSIFIGYPMCVNLFGTDAVFFVLCYFLVNTTFFQTVCVGMLNYSGRAENAVPSFKAMIKGMIKPPVCAILLCTILVLLRVELPPLVMRFASAMGNTVTPLALVFTGFVIYDLGLKNLRIDRSLSVMLILRFLLSPLLCFGFCVLFGVSGLAKDVMVVEHAMPVMTQVIVLSADCGADEDYAAVGTALTTLACFVVIPLLMLVL